MSVRFPILAAVAVVAFPLLATACAPAATPTPQPVKAKRWSSPPPMTIDQSKSYRAVFKTGKGDIVVKLLADKAPLTVNSFVFLARNGFYDNTTFHRVLKDFMAQGGDPTGSGSGDPGYKYADEVRPDLTFDQPGLLAMANSGPNTNGSQFFLTFVPTPWLNGNHTIFGKVVSGMDVLLSIPLRDPSKATTPGERLITVEIREE
jgi:cyclophilin family peptidyl-prolyl cis-trans isomerase